MRRFLVCAPSGLRGAVMGGSGGRFLDEYPMTLSTGKYSGKEIDRNEGRIQKPSQTGILHAPSPFTPPPDHCRSLRRNCRLARLESDSCPDSVRHHFHGFGGRSRGSSLRSTLDLDAKLRAVDQGERRSRRDGVSSMGLTSARPSGAAVDLESLACRILREP